LVRRKTSIGAGNNSWRANISFCGKHHPGL
jgi:hypothetical protein